MANVFISPSVQEYNHFYGGGSEEYYMNLIADELAENLRRGEAAKAFTTAIEKCGELLAEKFPAHEENPNEFPDGLVIVEDAEW